MLIWNGTTHELRIKGVKRLTFDVSRLSSPLPEIEIEQAAKAFVDPLIAEDGYHFYLHIIDKATFNYVIWLGSVNIIPSNTWWETTL
jgi:hypothetical protein